MQSTRYGTSPDVTVGIAMVAVTLALLAALGYAVASVLQHRAAAAVPHELSMRLGLITRLLGRPLWLAGFTADITAFGFEAWALSVGSLVVVQPVMVLGLPIALVLGAAWDGRHFSRHEASATAAVCGGLALFLVLSAPTRGHDAAAIDRWIAVGVTSGLGVAACLVVGHRGARWRATWLATATGLVFAVSAALTKSAASLVRHVGFGAVGHWEIYALAAVGGLSMLLAQSAFQAGPLAESLPAITLVPPFASAAIGMFLFGERAGAPPVLLVVAVAGAAIAVAGVVALARSPLAESAYSPTPAADSPPATARNIAGWSNAAGPRT